MEKKIDVTVGATVRLPKSDVDVGLLRKQLTATPTVSGKSLGFGEKEEVRMYREDAQYIYIPRRYGMEQYVLNGFTDERTAPAVKLGFCGDLREGQEPACREVLQELQNTKWNGAIMQAPTGFGKTPMALWIAAQLGLRTLVVVHKEFLVDQWRERIKQFLGLKDEEIGHIQQDECRYRNLPVSVGMIQSLAEREYDPGLYKAFGLVIVDETHHLSAPVWSRASGRFFARFTLGLSASPFRSDGLDKVLWYTIGEPIRVGTWDLKPQVYMIFLPTKLEARRYTAYWQHTAKKDVILGRLINGMCNDMARNSFIVGQAIKACKSGRKCMVLSDRRSHLEKLKDLFDSRVQNREFTSSFFWAGLEGYERSRAVKANVLFATFQYAGEALDLPELDTVYLTTPKTQGAYQAIGRILRYHPDKKEPIVVDIVDYNIPILRKFAEKRYREYKLRQFPVQLVDLARS